jgi:hypothetical protein
MHEVIDLPAARRFTSELNEELRRCDNGEGDVCSTLDARIEHYEGACARLREIVYSWGRDVFTGRVEFNDETEAVLKKELRELLDRAQRVAEQGHALNWECFELTKLPMLDWYVADFGFLLAHWVRPRRAVSPAPRVRIPDAAAREIAESLRSLPPAPPAGLR